MALSTAVAQQKHKQKRHQQKQHSRKTTSYDLISQLPSRGSMDIRPTPQHRTRACQRPSSGLAYRRKSYHTASHTERHHRAPRAFAGHACYIQHLPPCHLASTSLSIQHLQPALTAQIYHHPAKQPPAAQRIAAPAAPEPPHKATNGKRGRYTAAPGDKHN